MIGQKHIPQTITGDQAEKIAKTLPGKDCTQERAFDTDALSSFNCGIREIDQLIHKKEGGLRSFVSEVPCELLIS